VKNYRQDIDGLRAFAVMPVLLFHFGLEQLPGGFAGVDVFFVISGYLIAGTLLKDLQTDRFSLWTFYWRRFRRILPALFVVLAASTVAAVLLLPADQLVDFAWTLLSTSTFWSNIYFWDTTNYFGASAELKPLLHTWSLAVEEQYYIFAPIAMWLIYRFLGQRWTLVLLPLILMSFALSVYGLKAGPSFTFYWLPTRAWELMIGAYLMLAPPPKLSSRIAQETVGILGWLCLGIAYFTLTKTSAFPAQGALLPCIGTALLIYAGSHQTDGKRPMASRVLEVAPVVWIGLISYSLYLVHWPLVSFLTHYTMEPVEHVVMLTVVSIVLAAFMWRFVEQPFRKNPVLKSKPVVFAASFGAMAIAALTMVIIVSADGFPGRAPDYVRQDVQTTSWRNKVCFFKNGENIGKFSVEACTHDLGFDDAKILLWGDSFNAQYIAGLADNSARLGSNVVQITHAGCPPILDYNSAGLPKCAALNQKALRLLDSGDYSVVILSGLWDSHKERVLTHFADTVSAIKERGAEVIVIGQSPNYSDDVQRIAHVAKRRGNDPWLIKTRTSSTMKAALQEQTALGGGIFIDPIDLLCTGDICPIADDVDFYAFDHGHMGNRGASRALGLYLDHILGEKSSLMELDK
jgi:peptidoglycan/LPS O-acetylase OafA/YrhL